MNDVCSTALKQELNWQIDSLPDESVQLLIEVAKSMSRPHASVSNGREMPVDGKNGILGVFADRPFRMADDFTETPECFEEYM